MGYLPRGGGLPAGRQAKPNFGKKFELGCKSAHNFILLFKENKIYCRKEKGIRRARVVPPERDCV